MINQINNYPKDWQEVKLGDICDIFKGSGLSKDKLDPKGNNKCILYGELFTKYNEIIKEIISKTNFDQGIKSKIGDILIPGSTTTIGIDLARASFLNENNVLLGGDINIVRKKDEFENRINSIYLAYYITNISKYDIATKSKGITIIHLQGKDIATLKILIPIDPKEQTAIAQILSSVDNTIQQTDELIKQTETLKKGLMSELLTKGIGHKKFKQTELGEIPEDWEIKRLGDIFKIAAGGDLDKDSFSSIKDENHQYPIYSNSLENNGLYGYSSKYTYNDNCITITGRGTLGVANCRYLKFNAIIRVLVLIPKLKLNCFYVSEYINNMITFFIGSTGVPQLTVPQVSIYKVALPPLSEQKQISEILSTVDKEIDELKTKKSYYNTLKKGLMSDLLTGKVRVKI